MNYNNSYKLILNIPTLVGIVFLILKLGGVLDIPWVWVLSPFWITYCLSVITIIYLMIVNFIISILTAINNKNLK